MSTTGYCSTDASEEFCCGTMPPVGCAPVHETLTFWRSRRSWVWLTDTETVLVSTTFLTPLTRFTRLIFLVFVNAAWADVTAAGEAIVACAATAPPRAAPGPTTSPSSAATVARPASRRLLRLLMPHPREVAEPSPAVVGAALRSAGSPASAALRPPPGPRA